MRKYKSVVLPLGVFLIFIGYIGLITGATSFQILSLEVIHPSFPSEAHIDVPFYTHDANYIYLNPDGLCRFAVREMIIAYWIQKGYVSGSVPSQYTLYVEEKHGLYNETMYEASYIDRGLFVVDHIFFMSYRLNWASYTNHILTRIDVSPELSVNLVKTYISLGIPVDAAVAVNEEGWADPNGYPLPNHGVVFTGYNTTHIFYNNPISLNLSKPSCGKDRAMPFQYLIDGTRDNLWWLDAVFPVNYAPIVQTVTVKVEPNSMIYTPWEGKSTGPTGIVTINTLKVGCVASINTDIRNTANKYSSFFKATYNQNEWGGLYMFYPDTNTVSIPKLDGTVTVGSLTPHLPEPIPEKPINPNPDPSYPYEPIPYYNVESPAVPPQLMWYGFIISGVSLLMIGWRKMK